MAISENVSFRTNPRELNKARHWLELGPSRFTVRYFADWPTIPFVRPSGYGPLLHQIFFSAAKTDFISEPTATATDITWATKQRSAAATKSANGELTDRKSAALV